MKALLWLLLMSFFAGFIYLMMNLEDEQTNLDFYEKKRKGVGY